MASLNCHGPGRLVVLIPECDQERCLPDRPVVAFVVVGQFFVFSIIGHCQDDVFVRVKDRAYLHGQGYHVRASRSDAPTLLKALNNAEPIYLGHEVTKDILSQVMNCTQF